MSACIIRRRWVGEGHDEGHGADANKSLAIGHESSRTADGI